MDVIIGAGLLMLVFGGSGSSSGGSGSTGRLATTNASNLPTVGRSTADKVVDALAALAKAGVDAYQQQQNQVQNS